MINKLTRARFSKKIQQWPDCAKQKESGPRKNSPPGPLLDLSDNMFTTCTRPAARIGIASI